MAISVTLDSGQDGRAAAGDKLIRRGVLNLGTYATNGVAIAKTDLDLPVSVNHLDIGSAGGIVFEWDKTNGKIKAYWQTDPANAGGANIALIEVTNSTNLTTKVARFFAQGN